jgi:hypothetical protein
LRHFAALLIAASLVIFGAHSIPGPATSSLVQISFPNRFEQVPLRIYDSRASQSHLLSFILDAIANT